MSQNIPYSLDYGSPDTALVHRYSPDVMFPTGSYSTTNDAAIRFNIKRSSFWDPYSVYFKVAITVPQTYLVGQQSPLQQDFNFTSTQTAYSKTVGNLTLGGTGVTQIKVANNYGWDLNSNPASCQRGLVLDHSIYSLLREIVITDSNNVIERIRDVDVLAAMLNDMAFFDIDHKARRWCGFGGLHTSTLQAGATKCQSIDAGGVMSCIAGDTCAAYLPHGESVNIWSNPLISQHFSGVGKSYHKVKGGGAAANSNIGTMTTTKMINGITSVRAAMNYQYSDGANFGGAVLIFDEGAGIPPILNVTGNPFTGCPFTPATLNLLDLANTDSPYFTPPLNYDAYTINMIKPEVSGFLPFTSDLSTGSTADGLIQLGEGVTICQAFEHNIAPDGTVAADAPYSSSVLQIRDLTDGLRNYSEFINGSPNMFNAGWAQTSFEPVWSYDMIVGSSLNGSSTWETFIQSFQQSFTYSTTAIGAANGSLPYVNPLSNASQFGQQLKAVSNNISSAQMTQTFLLPLPSTLIGRWVPMDKYKLIPLMGFQDLVIELRLNPHAFYTTFFSATNDARQYQIANIQLQCELAEFFDNAIADSVSSELKRGLTLYSQGWADCLAYTIQGTNIPNNLQINKSFDSLKMLLYCFIDNAYLTASCFRKQFRLSPNINQHFLKIGMDQYPILPFIADSGTTIGVNNTNEFFYQYLQAFGLQFKPGQFALNPANMSIGQRRFYFNSGSVAWYNTVCKSLMSGNGGLGPVGFTAYQSPGDIVDGTTQENGQYAMGSMLGHPLDIGTLSLPLTTLNGNNYIPSATQNVYQYLCATLAQNKLSVSQPNTTSQQTSGTQFTPSPEFMFAVMAFCGNLQYCYFCENSMVGRAMFAIDLDSLNVDKAMYSGVSTQGVKPFDLMIKNNVNGTSSFQGSMTLYAWGLYDQTLVIKTGVPAKVSGYT